LNSHDGRSERQKMMDESREVEAVVRRYFGALTEFGDRSEYIPKERIPLYMATRRIKEKSKVKSSEDVVINEVRALHVQGNLASVALDATEIYSEAHPERGEYSWRTRYSGPVELRRIDGRWKIFDYKVNGRSIAASNVLGRGYTERVEGIEVEVLGAEMAQAYTFVTLRVRNGRVRPVRIIGASLKTFASSRPMLQVDPREEVGADAELVAAVGWGKAVSLRRRRLDFSLHFLEEETQNRIDFRFSMPLDAS
jgi:hypothetical protein